MTVSTEEDIRRVESLKQELARAASPGERLDLLGRIGSALIPVSISEARAFFDQAILLAHDTKDYQSMARSGRIMAEALGEAGDAATALLYAEYVKEAGAAAGNHQWNGSYFYICGEIHTWHSDYTDARRCYETARTIWQQGGYAAGEQAVLNQLGNLCGLTGRWAESLAYFQDSLHLATEQGDRYTQATAGSNVGWALLKLGRWEDAAESFYRVLAITDVPGIKTLHLCVYNYLGELFLCRDKPAKAVDILRNVIDDRTQPESYAERLRDALTIAGQAHVRMADFAAAAEFYERALRLAREAGSPRDETSTLILMAELCLTQGDLGRAWELDEQALAAARAIGIRVEESDALRIRGLVCAARGDSDESDRSFEQALVLLQDAEESYELAKVRFHYGRFLLNEGRRDKATGLLKAAGRVFRKLSVVAEAEEINRLLFRQEMQADSDVALLQGISGLTPMGLEPPTFIEQSLRLLREGLRFDSAAVLYRGRPIVVQGRPNLSQARAMGLSADSTATPTALSWPVRCGSTQPGRIYLERATPIQSEHSPLVLDTIANLLAIAVQRTAEIELKTSEEPEDLAGLRFHGVVGRNAAFRETLRTACRVAEADVPVLIRGESGTGKELVARALHESGPRASQPFVAVNCAALPENLLEAEFFGIEKGAATGVSARRGKFEAADGGTVFLDEIGDMSPALQAKLLRVLQDNVVERVGSNHPVQVDARVVAATNQDLEKLMQQGTFRSDLYYRLNTVELRVPSLRERIEDLPDLVRHLITVSNHEYGRSVAGVSPDVQHRLTLYPWPGNIRELQHAIERAVILARGELIEMSDMPPEIARSEPAGDVRSRRRKTETAASVAEEKAAIIACLREAEWNVSRAAKLAGYSRAQFYRLMAKHSLSRDGQKHLI